MIQHIDHITPWLSLEDVSSSTSIKAGDYWGNIYKGDYVGVYQVSLEKPEDLIHPEIGYIGKSKIIPTRLYELSNNTRSEKANSHNCGRYLRDAGVTTDKVFFRVLFASINSYGDLETYLQNEMRDKYNYTTGFKWTEATAGVHATYLKFKDIANRLSPEELAEAQGYIISLMVQNEVKKLSARDLDGFF
jgi:hypothetical protein